MNNNNATLSLLVMLCSWHVDRTGGMGRVPIEMIEALRKLLLLKPVIDTTCLPVKLGVNKHQSTSNHFITTNKMDS